MGLDAAGEQGRRRGGSCFPNHFPKHISHLFEINLAVLVQVELLDELLDLDLLRTPSLAHFLEGGCEKGKKFVH
jgi:hypothetical protein